MSEVKVTVVRMNGEVLSGRYPVRTVKQAVFSALTDEGLWVPEVRSIALEVSRG